MCDTELIPQCHWQAGLEPYERAIGSILAADRMAAAEASVRALPHTFKPHATIVPYKELPRSCVNEFSVLRGRTRRAAGGLALNLPPRHCHKRFKPSVQAEVVPILLAMWVEGMHRRAESRTWRVSTSARETSRVMRGLREFRS